MTSFFRPPCFANEGIVSDRAWILSVMKVAATAAQVVPPRLAFFQNDVLGLARLSDQLAIDGPSASEMKSQRSRVLDLWNLFPCFCKSPSDVGNGLAPLTVVLGRALEDKRYPELLVRSVSTTTSGSFVKGFSHFLLDTTRPLYATAYQLS